jgi:hypothetical protein
MILNITQSDWKVVALASGVAGLLSLLMFCFLWYFKQPMITDLSTKKVVIVNAKEIKWSKGAMTTLRYVEFYAVSATNKTPERYILSKLSEGLHENIKRSAGECVIWYDPKQANEIFQIQVGGKTVIGYDEVYAFKTEGAESWWQIMSLIFALSLSIFSLAIWKLRKPQSI